MTAGFQILTGDTLDNPTGKAWTELGAIDQLSHGHSWERVRHLPAELITIERRMDTLIAHGWQNVFVVTDHSWLTLPTGLPEAELPEHWTLSRKGRCAVLKEGANSDQHAVPWHRNKDMRIAVASAIALHCGGKTTVRQSSHHSDHGSVCIFSALVISISMDWQSHNSL